jgi:hypothetical protein
VYSSGGQLALGQGTLTLHGVEVANAPNGAVSTRAPGVQLAVYKGKRRVTKERRERAWKRNENVKREVEKERTGWNKKRKWKRKEQGGTREEKSFSP